MTTAAIDTAPASGPLVAPEQAAQGVAPVLTPTRGRRWLRSFGELMAVGGATPLLYLASFLIRRLMDFDAAELGVSFFFFYLAYIVNDPHFGVTYVLFYKDVRARAFGNAFPPMQRARYLLAGIIVPIVLVAWSAYGIATKSAPAMGAMFEAMYMLVGWHYVKQGFGVMMVLSARRGVTYLPRERIALLIHCLAGWVFAWANPHTGPHEAEEKGVVYTTLPHPAALEVAAGVVLVASSVAVLVLLALKWRREKRLPIGTPLLALVASVWSWSIFSSTDPLVLYMIPALHSIQYIYFVGLLKRNEARDQEGPPFFDTSAMARLGLLVAGALLVGWLFFHGAPTLLDDVLVGKRAKNGVLGPTPYFAALYAFVNIHHYFMDTVIWRRENPLTRYLRVQQPTPAA